ncbi:hypothetical protein MMC21_003170 [Puttea exsequens]|nr:hypothetical protein [Puttea exsequens]
MEFHPLLYLYNLIQWFLDKLLSPTPPPPYASLSRPRIAVIGTGLTGVSSAAHCVGHGFDVTIFEAGGEKSLGGIWSQVNNTSGLQIHSIMYRFHPSVRWSSGYPDRQQIVSQIRELWKRYGLKERTKFHTRVAKVYQDKQGRWTINDPSNGRFDGGGASAVEALEFVTHTGASSTSVLARSDKWIIPRNAFVDVLLAFNIFGQETVFSWIPETFLRKFFYRDLSDLAPQSEGLFTETPMVNSDIFHQIRAGKAEWLRGDIIGFTEIGIKFNHRAKGVPKNGPGRESVVEGDMVIMATGFQRPSLSFLPDEVFTEPYQPPNWYLQCFPPEHVSICANNCTYVNAIGTVGNYHVGIYTRFLLMFLVDPLARPNEYWMKRWIDMTKTLKEFAPTGAFDFFTYSELIYWFVFCIAINPFRWKWGIFVLFGIGQAVPLNVVKKENQLRNGLGMRKRVT